MNNKKNDFVHLHVHSEYSLLDGLARIKDLVQEAVNQNATALAITDHGNVYGAIKFYNACKRAKIKPILGCEFYVADNIEEKDNMNRENDHLILLAKNNVGFKNLAKLNTIAFLDGLYYKPRIDLEKLAEHSEGLICLSACIAGRIPRLLLDDFNPTRYEDAKSYALTLKNIFAPGDFYIEIQNHGLKEQKLTNPLLVKIAKEIGVKYVATNDVHYTKKTDAKFHDILLCVQTNKKVSDDNRMRFPNNEFYFKSKEEMEDIFKSYPEALTTTQEIADKCNVDFQFNKYQLPEYKCPGDYTPSDYLRHICYKGMEKRYGSISDEYRERAETELSVIISMGFAEYYLIVWDFIDWAKKNDIPVGPGRGSGVGSIVAYSIGITDVDPMKYGLIFERFLNEDRTSMPDFDIDFCPERRADVVNYVSDKYGEDHISKIITFGCMKKKQAIRDVARAFDLSFDESSKLVKLIPENIYKEKNTTITLESGEEIKKSLEITDMINPRSDKYIPELESAYNNSEIYKQVIEAASKFDNLPRHTGVHAAGVVIYKNPAYETLPLAKNGEDITTQFDKDEVEKLGLLKMDFLGLVTLTDIKLAKDNIKDSYGIEIELGSSYDDPETYELISNGETDAVFQLESPGMRSFMKQLKPKSLEDITVGVALYRPGPMDNIPQFLNGSLNPETVTYLHPLLEPILSLTAGIIVYQEQAMMITRVLAGYSLNRADYFRAIISKKKTKEMEAEKPIFINGLRNEDGSLKTDENGKVLVPGCIENGIDKKIAEKIYSQMEKFGEYAFNKSHAAAYAAVAYATAYLKAHYPVEYMAAVINNRIAKSTDMVKYLQVIKHMGISIIRPDINQGYKYFRAEGRKIRYGLGCIKGIGMQVIEDIISERQANGKYESFYDFIFRTQQLNSKPTSRVYENLIYGGALDSFGLFRSTMIANLPLIVQKAKANINSIKSYDNCILSFFGEKIELDESIDYPQSKEYPKSALLSQEFGVLSMYVSGHPLDKVSNAFDNLNFNSAMSAEKPEEDIDYSTFQDQADSEEYFNKSIADDIVLKDKMEVRFIGIIRSLEKRTSKKNGSTYYQLKIEDLHGNIDAIVFEHAAKRFENALQIDKAVLVLGTLSLFDDGKFSVRCDKLEEINLQDQHLQKDNRKLCIRINTVNLNIIEDIEKILANNPGENEVYYQYNRKIYKFNTKINSLEKSEKDLIDFLGSSNVKIVK